MTTQQNPTSTASTRGGVLELTGDNLISTVDLTDDKVQNCALCLDVLKVQDRLYLFTECGHVSQASTSFLMSY